MRDYLKKTWVKAGLAIMALPTALAEATPAGDGGQGVATIGLTVSLDQSGGPGSGVVYGLDVLRGSLQ